MSTNVHRKLEISAEMSRKCGNIHRKDQGSHKEVRKYPQEVTNMSKRSSEMSRKYQTNMFQRNANMSQGSTKVRKKC